MDHGRVGGASIASVRQELALLQGKGDNTKVGLDSEGRLVTEDESNSSFFSVYQKALIQLLVNERTPRQKQLKDRNIIIAIPDNLTLGALNAALHGLDAADQPAPAPSVSTPPQTKAGGRASPSDLNRYFTPELMEHTRQHHQDLYAQIQEAPKSQLGDLARRAKEERDVDAVIEQINKSELSSPVAGAKPDTTTVTDSGPATVSSRTAPSTSGKKRPVPKPRTKKPPLSPAAQVAQNYALNPEQLAAFNNVYGQSENIREMETALTACSLFYQSGSDMPLDFLLNVMKENPEAANRFADIEADTPFEFKQQAEDLFRQCVLKYAGLTNASDNINKSLTTINLWHNPSIENQLVALKKLDMAHNAINGGSMGDDTLVFALADQQMDPAKIEEILELPTLINLLDKQKEAADNPNIKAIAQRTDGIDTHPSSKVLCICQDVARYVVGNMPQAEVYRKSESISQALDAVSYNWLTTHINNDQKLRQFISKTTGLLETSGGVSAFADSLKGWYHSRQPGQYFSSLPVVTQKILRRIYDQIAITELESFSDQLRDLEPLPAVASHLESFKNGIQSSQDFVNPQQLDAVAQRFENLGLKPGPRTMGDGNCGFASIALLTGDSPKQVRARARQVALDMQSYIDNQDTDQIEGDIAYKRRIETAVRSYQDNAWVEGLQSPGERAEIVGLDPTEVDLSLKEKYGPEAFWMDYADCQYLSVAYNRPVFTLAEVDEGGRHFAKYTTAEGELKYCFDDATYNQGLACFENQEPSQAPLALINLGKYQFAHWMPMVSTSAPPETQYAQYNSISGEDVLTSIRQGQEERRHYLEHMKQNPQWRPAGQAFIPRPGSPGYSERSGSDEAGQENFLQNQYQRLLDEDPYMSLQVGAIGSDRDSFSLADVSKSMDSLDISAPEPLKLPPPHAANTPGFKDFGSRTSFINSGLKQLIVALGTEDVDSIKNRARALRRSNPGTYLSTAKTNYGDKREVRDGGKRAEVMLKFASLAEATMRARSGEPVSDITEKQKSLHNACYELGQSADIKAGLFRRLFPYNEDHDYGGPGSDAREYLAGLLDIIDEDHQLSSPLPHRYQTGAVNNPSLVTYGNSGEAPVVSIPVDGKGLQDLFRPGTTSVDGKKHPRVQIRQYGHREPSSIQRVNIQAKAFSVSPYTGETRKLTKEARALVMEHPFEQLEVPLENTGTGIIEKTGLNIKSMVAHTGDSADKGSYIALEKEGSQWFVYDNEQTYPIDDLQSFFRRSPEMIPYLFCYEKA